VRDRKLVPLCVYALGPDLDLDRSSFYFVFML